MRHQEQPKNPFWYSFGLPLILLFLSIYVAVPIIMIVLKDKWLNGVPNSCLTLTLLFIAIISLLLFIWHFHSYKKSIQTALEEGIKNSKFIEDGLKNWFKDGGAIEAAFKTAFEKNQWFNDMLAESFNYNGKARSEFKRIVGDENVIKNALEAALKDGSVAAASLDMALKNNSVIEDALNALFGESGKGREALEAAFEVKGKGRDALHKAFEDSELMKSALSGAFRSDTINEVLRESLKQKINDLLNKEPITSQVQTEINNLLTAISNERDAQKYRFVERVVSEICKNNKPNACDIAQIRAMIGDVFGTNHMCQCWDMSEDDNKVIFTIHDINCKNLIITYYRDNKAIDFSSTDGEYTLCNGVVITIKGGKIDDIKKP